MEDHFREDDLLADHPLADHLLANNHYLHFQILFFRVIFDAVDGFSLGERQRAFENLAHVEVAFECVLSEKKQLQDQWLKCTDNVTQTKVT